MSDLNLNTYGKLNSRLGLLPRVLYTVSDTPRKSHAIAEVGGSLWADEIEDIGTSEKRIRVMPIVEIVWAYIWK